MLHSKRYVVDSSRLLYVICYNTLGNYLKNPYKDTLKHTINVSRWNFLKCRQHLCNPQIGKKKTKIIKSQI